MKKGSFTQEQVAAVLSEAGFSPAERELQALHAYLTQLMKWNKVMNLVGPYSWQDVLRALVVDSLHLAVFLKSLPLADNPRCWDVGAGAGLPGIPLRAVWGEGTYTLVEVREKRTLFMEQVLARMELPSISVYRGRIEDFMEENDPADLILSRAFMPWRKMLDLISGHIAPTGRVVFLTREPLPEGVPTGWQTEVEYCYTVGETARYFWSVAPSNAPS